MVDDETFPFAFVLVEGVARTERLAAEALLPWSRRIAERYVPADHVDRTASRNAVEGELLVRVSMQRLVGSSDVAA